MLDKIIVFIAIAALIAFCGVVVGFVAEPDLIVVTLLVLALASHDFWVSVFKPGAAETDLDPADSLENRPTAVSGKPAPKKKAAAAKRKTAKK